MPFEFGPPAVYKPTDELLGELLLELHMRTGFLSEFTHISEGKSRVGDLPTILCAVLIASAACFSFAATLLWSSLFFKCPAGKAAPRAATCSPVSLLIGTATAMRPGVLSSLLTANPASRTFAIRFKISLSDLGWEFAGDFSLTPVKRLIISASLNPASNVLPAALEKAGTRDPISTVTLTLSVPSTLSTNKTEEPSRTPNVIVCLSSWTRLAIAFRTFSRLPPAMKPLPT